MKIKLILELIKPYRKLIIIVIFVMIMDVAGGLLIPTITAHIINHGLGGGNMDYLIKQGIIMGGISVFACVCTLTDGYLCADLSSKVGRDLRNAFYEKSLTFSEKGW